MLETDLIENLNSDLDDIQNYTTEVEDAANTAEAKVALIKLTDAVEKYFEAEEECVYARCLEAQDDVLVQFAKLGGRDHHDIRQILLSMRSADPQSSLWRDKVRELAEKVEDYVAREARELFPRLAKTFDDSQTEKMRKEYASFGIRRNIRAA